MHDALLYVPQGPYQLPVTTVMCAIVIGRPFVLNVISEPSLQLTWYGTLIQISIQNQVKAVDSEYMEGIQKDSEKICSILTSMLQPNHPYHGFSCGNRESLVVNPKKQNIDTLAELRKFYDKYYSANLMCLCVSQALHVARAN